MLKVYALSLVALWEDRRGDVQLEHNATWLILDERHDVAAMAEDALFEKFPEEEGFYNHTYLAAEVPLKVMKRAVEYNLYGEEPPARRSSVRPEGQRSSKGQDRRQLARYR